MTPTVVNWLTGLIAVLGGGAGVAALVNAFLTRKKIVSEASKTDMDAAAVMSEQVLKFMEVSSKQFKEMQETVREAERASRGAERALHEAQDEISKLRRHIETLNHLLSSHGIPAPPLPIPTPNGGSHHG